MVSRTLIRDLPDCSRVVVHLQLRERGDAVGLSPVFSADRYEPHGTHSGKTRHRRDRDPDSGGCLRRRSYVVGVAKCVQREEDEHAEGRRSVDRLGNTLGNNRCAEAA
jgi:hypothetical protein